MELIGAERQASYAAPDVLGEETTHTGHVNLHLRRGRRGLGFTRGRKAPCIDTTIGVSRHHQYMDNFGGMQEVFRRDYEASVDLVTILVERRRGTSTKQ
jgi:hypothetical protein